MHTTHTVPFSCPNQNTTYQYNILLGLVNIRSKGLTKQSLYFPGAKHVHIHCFTVFCFFNQHRYLYQFMYMHYYAGHKICTYMYIIVQIHYSAELQFCMEISVLPRSFFVNPLSSVLTIIQVISMYML